MFNLLKKTFFTTIGITYLTKEKIREVSKKYIEEANLSEEEGRKFFDELVKKSEEARSALEKIITEKSEKILKKFEIPSRDEFTTLTKRISIIEDRLSSLTNNS